MEASQGRRNGIEVMLIVVAVVVGVGAVVLLNDGPWITPVLIAVFVIGGSLLGDVVRRLRRPSA